MSKTRDEFVFFYTFRAKRVQVIVCARARAQIVKRPILNAIIIVFYGDL